MSVVEDFNGAVGMLLGHSVRPMEYIQVTSDEMPSHGLVPSTQDIQRIDYEKLAEALLRKIRQEAQLFPGKPLRDAEWPYSRPIEWPHYDRYPYAVYD